MVVPPVLEFQEQGVFLAKPVPDPKPGSLAAEPEDVPAQEEQGLAVLVSAAPTVVVL